MQKTTKKVYDMGLEREIDVPCPVLDGDFSEIADLQDSDLIKWLYLKVQELEEMLNEK